MTKDDLEILRAAWEATTSGLIMRQALRAIDGSAAALPNVAKLCADRLSCGNRNRRSRGARD
jgi:hypothetical protein